MKLRTVTRQVAFFLILAFGGAWILAAPLWLSGLGLSTPGAPVLLVALMFVPAAAAAITHRITPNRPRFLEATTLKPKDRFRRWAPYALLAWLAPILLTLASLVIASLLGTYQFDLIEFAGAREAITSIPGAEVPDLPVGALVAIQAAAMLVAPALNVIPALGEEVGWRGFLQTRLTPLGQWPAVLITGVVWGLWHAPVILLGYNYPGHHPLAALGMMALFCTLLSVLLGWLTIASGTVWTAAIAHGFINGVAGLGLLLSATGSIDTAAVGLLGVSGWIVMALIIAVLVALRQFPLARSNQADQAPSTVSTAD